MDASMFVEFVKRQAPSTNANDDKNVGSHRQGSPSLSGLVSSFVPFFLIFLAWMTAFVILRRMFPRQYAPRTFLGALRPQERTPAPPNTLFGWFPFMNKIPDTYVLQHNSLDAYFLLRYLKLSIVICVVGCCISWPVLFPINITGGGGQKQLNMLSFSNIKDKKRYYAHTFVSWVFIGFIFFLVTREMMYYISLRQAYLLSPLYAQRISSRTVLFQCVPLEYANEAKIRRMFGDELKNVWVASDTKELEKLVEDRTKAAMKLEAAETKLIKSANDGRLKSLKKGGQQQQQQQQAAYSNDTEHGGESGSAAARWVEPKKRPTHRLKFLIGKKVDTINWAREELARLNPLIEREQSKYRSGEAKSRNAVFVEFYDQVHAQAAFQMVAHHLPIHMSPRVIGLTPEDIIWSNLGITWKTLTIRHISSVALVSLTILFWSIPVAVVGAISQITYLIQVAPWLSFINKCPSVILGLITNLLPTIMLAVLMAVLPIYLRFMAKFGGKPTRSTVELTTHESFFWFQVIQVFLVTTMSSAASAAVPTIIKNPGSITTLLATNIPLASNFYLSYFMLQGLTFTSGAMVQIVGFILFNVLGKVLDSTPRKMYKRWSTLSSLGWGTVFPLIELLVVISITYSPIAPLMMGFAAIGLLLYYIAFRYNLLFVNTSVVDTKGLVYAKALHHTLVGCYLAVICLIGLFAIRTAIGPLILMIVFLIFMVLYHISMNAAVKPLLYYLPRSLEAEEDALLQSDAGYSSELHSQEVKDGRDGREDVPAAKPKPMAPPTEKEPSFLSKFLRPDVYCNYASMRRLVPHDFAHISYEPEIERHAYQHPAVNDATPLLWVPRDEMGVSQQECLHTNKITPITDEGALFNEKGKIMWDRDSTEGRPPIYQEKIYY